MAKIALQRGERDLAKAQYERILGKALIGRGSPAEHWAHAEYAWLQFEDGDLQVSALTTVHRKAKLKQPQGDCQATNPVQRLCYMPLCGKRSSHRRALKTPICLQLLDCIDMPVRLAIEIEDAPHSLYARLETDYGDVPQTACTHLQKALDVAQREGCMVTDSEIADHHYKLGRILWTMGGHARDDPGQARKHFEAAAIEENDSQVQPR